jgi:hypothetical protein
MKKLFTFALLFMAGGAAAQDMMALRNGNIETVKILEVGDNEIKYKKWENQEGPTFSTATANVLSVKFENGTNQKFDTATPAAGYTQKSNEGFSFHLGAALPTGDFADEKYAPQGGAGTGFALGMKNTWAVNASGLGIFLSADFIYNGVNSEVKDIFDEIEEEGSEVTIPHSINIPVLFGFNYLYRADPKLGLWCEAGVGPNFRMISDESMVYTEYGYHFSSEETYKMSTSVALQAGTGLMLNDKFSMGLHYYSLGKAKLRYEYTEKETGYDDYTEKGSYKARPVNVFMVRLGYKF